MLFNFLHIQYYLLVFTMKDQPIVVKKIKKAAHGAHGGAWKVAYADFVTAMMAFFLLMWLLNATESQKLGGIANYFTPTQGLKDRMGIGFSGGVATVDKGIDLADSGSEGFVFGTPQIGPIIEIRKQIEELATEDSQVFFTQIQTMVEKHIQKTKIDSIYPGIREAIQYEQTPEGLRIQIFNPNDEPMFDIGKVTLKPFARDVLMQIVQILKYVPNYISVSGHASDKHWENSVYKNWKLSSDRAFAVVDFLIAQGLHANQIGRLVAKADRDPIDFDSPHAPKNRRIDIIILRKSLTPLHQYVISPSMIIQDVEKFSNELAE